jgi:hypothetical protein
LFPRQYLAALLAAEAAGVHWWGETVRVVGAVCGFSGNGEGSESPPRFLGAELFAVRFSVLFIQNFFWYYFKKLVI